MDTRFYLFAGEPSGDLHGSHLLKQLRINHPTAIFEGVGGPLMREEGLRIEPLQMENFAVMGFIDVFKSLSRLIRQFRQVSQTILSNRPEAVILIDYPDFNLRLAKNLRKKGYKGKIIQYISPSVWAWRKNRIQMMAKYNDLLLTIYPFEKQYFQNTSLAVTFVGNPLSEYLANYPYQETWKNELNIPHELSLLAIFPGSRESELDHNLPLQLQAAKLLLQEESKGIAISCSTPKHAAIIQKHLNALELPKNNVFIVPSKYTYELMRDSHTALAKSGTVTLELALHHRPTVVTYQLSALNHFIGQYLLRIKLPFYCIVNILLEKTVFPEFIEKMISPKDIFHALQQLDRDTQTRQECLNNCQQLSTLLGYQNASQQAAEAISRSLL
ncbi:MAG: lipid-A-disaccharide synthase [Parachlamydiaceae bacterium]